MPNNIKTINDILSFCENPADFHYFDHRINRPIYYRVSDRNSFVGLEVTNIDFEDNPLLFLAPNAIGILLQTSQKYKNLAQELFNLKIDPKINNHSIENIDDNIRKDFIIKNTKIANDFIQFVQISIVFGYTAVESFANMSIPVTYSHEIKGRKSGIKEIYDKSAIERWISLSDKLSNILTKALETDEITDQVFWEDFTILEKLRHKIIHPKSSGQIDFFKDYFDRSVFKIIDSSREVLKFFFSSLSKNEKTLPYWPSGLDNEDRIPIRDISSNDYDIIGELFKE